MNTNIFLLSTFIQNTRVGTDVQSIRKRFHILSIISITVGMNLIISGYELIMWFTANPPKPFLMTSISCVCVPLILLLLRKGKQDASATIMVLYMHAANFSAGWIAGVPLIGLYGLMLFPQFAFFLTSSRGPRNLNIVLCILQTVRHIHHARKIFNIMVDEEQSMQMYTFYIAALVCVIVTCATASFQKSIETGVWQVAQTNYERSENLTKEVIQAAEAKDVFVSSLSHEIRNPLNALKGSIDYLLAAVKDPQFLDVLKNAKLSCEILLNLANNVLDAAKLKSNKMDISNTETNFADVIRKSLIINSETLKAKDITAEAFLDNNIPRVLWTDSSRLLQIAMNLLSNALKFTPKKGKIRIHATWCPKERSRESLLTPIIDFGHQYPLPRTNNTVEDVRHDDNLDANTQNINARRQNSVLEFSIEENEQRYQNIESITKTFSNNPSKLLNDSRDSVFIEPWIINQTNINAHNLTLDEREGYLKIQVSDTGSGVPEDQIPKLFEMFAQAHQSVNTMHGGTGLGLWICRQICQKMGGDIVLYSIVDLGTTFVFYVAVNNNRVIEDSNDRRNLTNNTVNVLIVDDYAYNRDLHKLLVQKEGAQAFIAPDARKAFDMFKAYEEGFFSFIMMDVLMPEINGFAAAKMIRQWEIEQKREKKADIYFVTGEYYNEEEVMAAFKTEGKLADVSGIRSMRKPIEVEMIRKAINSYQAK